MDRQINLKVNVKVINAEIQNAEDLDVHMFWRNI